MVYLRCGHVHGQHDWGIIRRSNATATAAGNDQKPDSANASAMASRGAGGLIQSHGGNEKVDLNSRRECPLCRKVKTTINNKNRIMMMIFQQRRNKNRLI